MLGNPALIKLTRDADLSRAVERRDIPAILTNPGFKALLRDEDFMRQLNALDLKSLYQKHHESSP
jgi:hypothetical protein